MEHPLKDKLLKIKWHDLKTLTKLETFIENSLTLPWLISSWALAYYEWYLLAMLASFMFFLTALRQSHNGFHHALGIPKFWTHIVLHINSLLMIASMHAVKFNHLRHHRFCLGEEDHEGKAAKMPALKAFFYGPLHIYHIHRIGWKEGGRFLRKRIEIDLVLVACFISLVWIWNIAFLKYHVIVMIVGESFSAFFAVWTVHHDLEEEHIARTQRKGWKNFLTYNMFYHLEHHLFPAVPTIKLPELARRIDKEVPEMEKRPVF